jgi:translation initiation factor 1
VKLNDLSQLSGLLSPEESEKLAKEAAQKNAKRKLGETQRDGEPVRVYIDRKMRRGKSVTIVEGLRISSEMRDKLGKDLKQLVSAGGTVHNDTIELQGEHVEKVTKYLTELAFKVKK